MATIYKIIEDLCNEHDITVSALARRADLDRNTIDKWNDPTRSPRVYNLKKVADYFGVTVDDLLPDRVAK